MIHLDPAILAEAEASVSQESDHYFSSKYGSYGSIDRGVCLGRAALKLTQFIALLESAERVRPPKGRPAKEESERNDTHQEEVARLNKVIAKLTEKLAKEAQRNAVLRRNTSAIEATVDSLRSTLDNHDAPKEVEEARPVTSTYPDPRRGVTYKEWESAWQDGRGTGTTTTTDTATRIVCARVAESEKGTVPREKYDAVVRSLACEIQRCNKVKSEPVDDNLYFKLCTLNGVEPIGDVK